MIRKILRRRRRVVSSDKKKDGRTDTARQQKLVKLILENIGTKGKTKSMYQMMLESGYAESTAHEQSGILSVIKEKPEVKNIVVRLEAMRDKAMRALEKKDLNKIDANSVARMMRDLNHDIELLSGRPTERGDDEVSLNPEDRERLDKILEVNKK